MNQPRRAVSGTPVPTRPGVRTWRPALTLALLAPLIGEVLFGAVPLSLLPFGLFGLIGLYGGGALVVRELVCRRRLSAVWIVLLGAAYAIVEEGLITQSLFDQHYRGLSFLGFYGHWAGVNWVWAAFIVPYHAIFSITIPILLAGLLAPGREDEPWLDWRGVTAAVAAFAINAALLAVFQTGLFTTRAPATSGAANLVAAFLVTAIVTAAFIAAPASSRDPVLSRPSASPRRLRLLGWLSGLSWFVGLRMIVIGNGRNVPAPVACVLALVMAALIAWRVAHWSAPSRAWTRESTYALVAGALPTCWLIGFLIAAVSGGSPVVNLAGQVIFGALMFAGLRAVHRVIRGAAVESTPRVL
jgi:hypothetical protein